MELLFSNIPPLKTNKNTFSSQYEKLMTEADYIKIASGYISTESLTEIKKVIEGNNRPSLDLVIGMHYFDGISRPQYEAALYLDDFLTTKKMGSVSIATTLPFHGKIYSFIKAGKPFAGMIGSSNLSSTLGFHRNYETDLFITDNKISNQISSFITEAKNRISQPISSWTPKEFKEVNSLLRGHELVERVSAFEYADIEARLTGITYKIPLKTALRSNLNVYFGKGRENTITGFVKPRHWYEVELIVPKSITGQSKYPKAGYPYKESIITVYTDDLWKFKCKISGTNSKNFRSYDDLKILGKWIKGRLELNGALHIGQKVTNDVLDKYGRHDFELKKTTIPDTWILDFGV